MNSPSSNSPLNPPHTPPAQRLRRLTVGSSWLFAIVSVVMVVPLALRTSAQKIRATSAIQGTDVRRQPVHELRPVPGIYGNLVRRTIRRFPAGDCVIEHYPDFHTSMDEFSFHREGDFGEIVFEPDNPWYAGQDSGSCSSRFNCCTFGVCDYIGLTPQDWVGTCPTVDGFPTPIAVIVDSHFDLVCEFSHREAMGRRTFEKDTRLQDGDVICFERFARGVDSLRREFTHVGRVKKKDGVNRMLSKFGQGPIAVTDLRFPDRMYPGAETVRVYRFRRELNL